MNMSKKTIIIAASLSAGALIIAGCSLNQKKAIANQLGVAAAVTWIGIDNPSPETIATVKTVVDVIRIGCVNVGGENASYYLEVYPLSEEWIEANVKPELKPAAKLGAAFILTGLDTAFAMNSDWSSNTVEATAIASSFLNGVKVGLSLPINSPVLIAAKRQTPVRSSR